MVKLVSFGLGGILIKEDNGWDIIREKYNIPNLWKWYMEGRITREEAKTKEYEIWKKQGVNKKGLEELLKNFTLMDGVEETIATLKERGIEIAIISDNPEFLVRAVGEKLGIKYLAYDRIIFDENGYAYDTKPTHPSVNRRVSKLNALKSFVKEENISLKQCAVVVNGSTDIDIISESGRSIALNPREEEISDFADKTIISKDLRDVLKLLSMMLAVLVH